MSKQKKHLKDYRPHEFLALTYFMEQIDDITFRTDNPNYPILYFDYKNGVISNHEIALAKGINNEFDRAFIWCPRPFRPMLLEWYFGNNLFENDMKKRECILSVRADSENGFSNNDYMYIEFLQETATKEAKDIQDLLALIGDKTEITAYRGEGNKSYHIDEDPMNGDYSENLVSWTLDPEVARFFASRYEAEDPKVYKATFKVSDIVAYDNGRQEKEILIAHENIYQYEKIN